MVLGIALGSSAAIGLVAGFVTRLFVRRTRRPGLLPSVGAAAGAALAVAFLAAWVGAVDAWPDLKVLALQGVFGSAAVVGLGALRARRAGVPVRPVPGAARLPGV